jgi:3-oxoacyl-[acyl-carrier-protein] synthase II
MGEGAGVLVLESRESAVQRGATILAEIVSSVTSCDAAHLTSPDLSGKIIAKTLEAALERAQILPNDVAFINAHGTSTKTNDIVEAKAIHQAFGSSIPVTSIKSMIGHTLGASGALACAASILSLNSLFIPPTVNYKDKDPDMLPIDIVSETRNLNTEKRYSMINAFGFGGHNACVVVKSP